METKKLRTVWRLVIPALAAVFLMPFGVSAASLTYQSFDGGSVPKNLEGVDYPTWYVGNVEGGEFTASIDTTKKIAGAGSLKLHLISDWDLYAQWNPYDGVGRDFARAYVANPAGWQFNTYDRMRLWLWHSAAGLPAFTDGQTNYYMGTYVKRVTNPDSTSDETGGGHYYHPFNVLPGEWSQCVFNSHPGHERGDPGGEDTGNRPYPTAPPWGSGDPANTYFYFDTLTRWYISETTHGGIATLPRDYWIDEIDFYDETNVENDEQVYSICLSRSLPVNRFFLTWNRPKDENDVDHEVRYAFSDIHALGWANATPAPSGIVSPPGWQGYNNMVYDTTAIAVASQPTIYFAIKPENSAVFSQIAFPLSGNDTTPPAVPSGLGVE